MLCKCSAVHCQRSILIEFTKLFLMWWIWIVPICYSAWPLNLSARVLRVPQDVSTIQGGLDSLINDDTLAVEPGTFGEVLIAPALRFTMIGTARPDRNARPLTIVSLSGMEISDTTAVLSLPYSSNVTVENFEFCNPTRNGVRSWADNVLLRNCTLDSMYIGFQQVGDSVADRIVLEHTRIRANFLAVLQRGILLP